MNVQVTPSFELADRRTTATTRAFENLSTRTPSDANHRQAGPRAVSPTSSILARKASDGNAMSTKGNGNVELDEEHNSSISFHPMQLDHASEASEILADATLDDITGLHDDEKIPPPLSSHVIAPNGGRVEVSTKARRSKKKPSSTGSTAVPPAADMTRDPSETAEEMPGHSGIVEAPSSSTKHDNAVVAENGKAPQSKAASKSKKPKPSIEQNVDLSITFSDWGRRPQRQAVTKPAVQRTSKAGKATSTQPKYKEHSSSSEGEDEGAYDDSEANESQDGSTMGEKVRKGVLHTRHGSSAGAEQAAQGRSLPSKKVVGRTSPVTVKEIVARQLEKDASDTEGTSNLRDQSFISSSSRAPAKKAKKPPSSRSAQSTQDLKTPPRVTTTASYSKGKGPEVREEIPSLTNDNDDDDGDEELPPLPSSGFLPVSAHAPIWDLSLLDESVFAALPAKRKDESEQKGGVDSAAEVPKFWWPARISSRNRHNFKVTLVQDLPKKEITKFS